MIQRLPIRQTVALMAMMAIAQFSLAQPISIIPQPVQLQKENIYFLITSNTTIGNSAMHPEISKIAHYLSSKIKSATGFSLDMVDKGGNIRLSLNSKPDEKIGNEGYTLLCVPALITINANTPAGLFYGVQTLIQLLPKEIESNSLINPVLWTVPAVSITDYPRFGWRGVMLDVSRHFFPKEFIKEYIDLLARYKYNRFHWHLTDDNGWRVEIKSYPRLTEVGAWRVPRTGTFGSNAAPKPEEAASDGGYYTQDDIREVVQYAKDRYIEIIPEIDVPGHSMAAIAAYPELCVTKDASIKVNPGSNFSNWFGNGKFEMLIDNTLNPTDEKVYQFLDKVFGEVAALFPFEYIHMGGDECYKGYWERNTDVQAFMKTNNIKNGEELQAYFNTRVNKIINSKKKKMIGWDEILEGGTIPNAAVMSWRGVKGGIEASHNKLPVVMSPAPLYYLDMNQGEPSVETPIYDHARLRDVYAFDILSQGIDSTFVLGGQANLWTEQIPTTSQAEYMTYPRALAVSETLWSPKSKKNWNDFSNRVESHFARFDAGKIHYSPAIYDPIIRVTKNDKGNLVIDLSTEVQWLDLYYTLDNAWPTSYSLKYTEPIVIPEDVDNFRVVSYRGGKQIGKVITLTPEALNKRLKK